MENCSSVPPPPGLIDKEYKDQDDMAAQGFLRLLKQLRIILLQDSVILQKVFPGHPMWQDRIFVRDDYQEFSRQLEASLLCTETPQEIQLQQSVPIIADQLGII
jgi:hypothetical protein